MRAYCEHEHEHDADVVGRCTCELAEQVGRVYSQCDAR